MGNRPPILLLGEDEGVRAHCDTWNQFSIRFQRLEFE